MNQMTLRPVQDADITLLTEWLNKEYILTWYHDGGEWLDEINQRKGSFSWIHHFIVLADDTPIGFCQYYDCFDGNGLENWYHVTQRGDTFSIDYLIGNEAYLGKGYGKAIIQLLTEMIQKKEHPRQIIVQPDKENKASNQVLLANGYRYDEAKEYFYKELKEVPWK